MFTYEESCLIIGNEIVNDLAEFHTSHNLKDKDALTMTEIVNKAIMRGFAFGSGKLKFSNQFFEEKVRALIQEAKEEVRNGKN